MVNSPGIGDSSASSTRLAAGLIGLGALLRIVSYHYSANTGGDAGARAMLATTWLQHPSAKIVFDVYPPGHFWLIGLSSLFVHDVVAASRLLSLALGIGSVVLVWALARLLYGDNAGLLSLAAFSFYSLHIGYSTTSSSEVGYLFFLLLALYAFFLYLDRESTPAWLLASSGLALSVSESVRFESWILFAALFWILAFFWWRRWNGQQTLVPLILFGATGGAWPAFMMLYSWRVYGNPMQLVSLNHQRVMHSLEGLSRTHQLVVLPVAILVSLSPLAVAGGFYGLSKSFRSRLTGAFALATLFFALIQAYQVATGGLLSLARYSLTLGTLLAVVCGFGLQLATEKLIPGRLATAQLAIIFLLLLNLAAVFFLSERPDRIGDELASVSPRLRYPRRIAIVGQFLQRHLQGDDAVIIDDYNVESDIIAQAAGLPILPGHRAYLASAKNTITAREYVAAEHPRFLVYSDRGTLRQWFPLPSECGGTEVLDGVEFHCVFTSPIYRVYEMSYR